ncbi:hypothetical protein GCM10010102_14300 [Promicromonospora citrea]|uniref:Uncharacterized protein n=1 Tax=Promicromonospora citrea TaxID=43677 RepID=A0A8H9GHS0_9MICO|nr:hypothetical protein GCM10010102_14300 [Promicromonospora citrea]
MVTETTAKMTQYQPAMVPIIRTATPAADRTALCRAARTSPSLPVVAAGVVVVMAARSSGR